MRKRTKLAFVVVYTDLGRQKLCKNDEQLNDGNRAPFYAVARLIKDRQLYFFTISMLNQTSTVLPMMRDDQTDRGTD